MTTQARAIQHDTSMRSDSALNTRNIENGNGRESIMTSINQNGNWWWDALFKVTLVLGPIALTTVSGCAISMNQRVTAIEFWKAETQGTRFTAIDGTQLKDSVNVKYDALRTEISALRAEIAVATSALKAQIDRIPLETQLVVQQLNENKRRIELLEAYTQKQQQGTAKP